MELIEVATAEIGYVEDKGNSTKYGKWFGLNNTAWCAIFVSWCYFKVGRPLPKIGWTKGYASCQYMYEYAVKRKLIVTDPMEGDIVLFDWNGDKRYEHTGIFVSKTKLSTTFISIEGNTSLVNQSNGGSVMKRKRLYKHAVFVRI